MKALYSKPSTTNSNIICGSFQEPKLNRISWTPRQWAGILGETCLVSSQALLVGSHLCTAPTSRKPWLPAEGCSACMHLDTSVPANVCLCKINRGALVGQAAAPFQTYLWLWGYRTLFLGGSSSFCVPSSDLHSVSV